MAFKYELKGFDKLQQKFRDLPRFIQKEIANELKDSADAIQGDARRNVPVDEGQIKGSISKEKLNTLGYAVIVRARHAPFMEFGTGPQKSIPVQLKGYGEEIFAKAKAYKSGINPLDALTAWVHRKGLAGTYSVKTRKRTFKRQGRVGTKKDIQQKEDRAVAFLIWRSIKKHGIKAHPFLFPAYFRETDQLPGKLTRVLKDAIR